MEGASMFRLSQVGPERSDCTCSFAVGLDNAYTVGEFISTVLAGRSDEWGYVGIKKDDSLFGEPRCEYYHGKLKTENLSSDILSKKVIGVSADGGWGNMNYLIVIEEREPINGADFDAWPKPYYN
jgi:hypothetical protein